MRRRQFIAILGSAAAWPLGLRAQQPTSKLYRIGVLETVSAILNAANMDAFRKGLQELGYIEGKNYVVEYRSADGVAARFPEHAAELADLGVDIIVTRGTPAAQAAKDATTKIPIVMAAIGEPLGVGVVSSLAHPGGNVTGFSAFVTELAGKRVELAKEAFPKSLRVALLNNMSNPIIPPQWEETEKATRLLGLQAVFLDVRAAEDVVRAFETAVSQRIDVLLVGIDTVTQVNRERIAELAAKHLLPAIYGSREFVDAGGLMAYGVSYPQLYFRAAVLVDKILKGAKPGDIPVQEPTKLELVINLKSAKAIGIELPTTVLERADEVIE
jgi:putative tryptophan/tyrosine transport system substrate-binding protein